MSLRLAALALLIPIPVLGQDHAHTPGMTHQAAGPTEVGQSAFAAVAEVVRLLEADPATDWTKVDLEALRQHLIDMDEVTLRATATGSPVTGGMAFQVVGAGRTGEAIRRIVTAHAPMLDREPAYRARAEATANGASLVVTARDPADQRTVTKIRALGLIGLLTVGAHHGPHHVAIARGDAAAHAHD